MSRKRRESGRAYISVRSTSARIRKLLLPADFFPREEGELLKPQAQQQRNIDAQPSRIDLQEAESAILTGLAETLEKNLSVEALLDELLRRCLEEAGLSGGLAYMLDQDGRLCLRAKRGSSDLETAVLENVP